MGNRWANWTVFALIFFIALAAIQGHLRSQEQPAITLLWTKSYPELVVSRSFAMEWNNSIVLVTFDPPAMATKISLVNPTNGEITREVNTLYIETISATLINDTVYLLRPDGTIFKVDLSTGSASQFTYIGGWTPSAVLCYFEEDPEHLYIFSQEYDPEIKVLSLSNGQVVDNVDLPDAFRPRKAIGCTHGKIIIYDWDSMKLYIYDIMSKTLHSISNVQESKAAYFDGNYYYVLRYVSGAYKIVVYDSNLNQVGSYNIPSVIWLAASPMKMGRYIYFPSVSAANKLLLVVFDTADKKVYVFDTGIDNISYLTNDASEGAGGMDYTVGNILVMGGATEHPSFTLYLAAFSVPGGGQPPVINSISLQGTLVDLHGNYWTFPHLSQEITLELNITDQDSNETYTSVFVNGVKVIEDTTDKIIHIPITYFNPGQNTINILVRDESYNADSQIIKVYYSDLNVELHISPEHTYAEDVAKVLITIPYNITYSTFEADLYIDSNLTLTQNITEVGTIVHYTNLTIGEHTITLDITKPGYFTGPVYSISKKVQVLRLPSGGVQVIEKTVTRTVTKYITVPANATNVTYPGIQAAVPWYARKDYIIALVILSAMAAYLGYEYGKRRYS